MTRLLITVLLLSVTLTATAMDLTILSGYQFNNDFEISASQNWSSVSPPSGVPGDDIEMKNGVVGSLAMDFIYKNHPNQRIGFFISHQETEIASNAGLSDQNMAITHAHITSMNYYPDGRWEPFILAGLGVGHYTPEDNTLKDVTRLSAQIGAGTNYKFTDNILLRFDVRWISSFFNNSSSVFCDGGCTVKIRSDTYSQIQTNAGIMFRF